MILAQFCLFLRVGCPKTLKSTHSREYDFIRGAINVVGEWVGGPGERGGGGHVSAR